jgi:mono/diheme cytochrome c family protein
MPAFDRLLADEEIAALIHFVQSLQPLPHELSDPVAIAPVAALESETVRHGRAIYLVSGCWSCHGLRGDGRGPSARSLTDDLDRPIRSTDFRYDPLKGGRDPLAIVRTLRTGLNGAPMPSYDAAMFFAREDFEDPALLPARFSDRDRDDIASYMRSAPGRAELERIDAVGRETLRDARLAALAYYVLSLDRRRGLRYRLLLEQPERERRRE